MIEFDFTNTDKVQEFLSSTKKDVSKFVAEYKGDRKIRRLQIGHRENLRQGTKVIDAEKINVNFQKKIVQTAASFLFGQHPDISIAGDFDKKTQKVLEAYKANRINNKLYDFSESVMSSTMGVFIFSKGGETGTDIKARFYNHENGRYTPQFDVYGDLIAFYWEFMIGEVKHLWIFTEDRIEKYMDDKYYKDESESHDFGVVPVVFMEQEEPEWWDVKELIDRLEMILSKLAGSNNYFAFPILKLKGQTVKNSEGKEENLIDVSADGKSILLGHAILNEQVVEADAEFLQRDTGIDSIKLEIEYLKEMIFSISRTPDLSFDNVKGIGAVSGRALKLMLQDAINKAKAKQNQYQVTLERILNVISAGQGNKEKLDFNIKFNLSLPDDLKEEIETLLEATGGHAILSQETGIKLNPYTNDADVELKNLRNEEAIRSGYGLNNPEDE